MNSHHHLGRRIIIVAILALLSTGGCGDDERSSTGSGGEAGATGDLAAALTSLVLSTASPLMPPFESAQLSYEVNLPIAESEVRITATALDPDASILVGDIAVDSGEETPPIALDLGTSALNVQVTASNGESLTYVVEITRGGGVLQQVAYAKASNTGADDGFGFGLAVFGDTLAVGATGEDSDVTGVGATRSEQGNSSVDGSGAVYIFRRTGSTWAQEAYVKASNTGDGDGFGGSLSLSADTLAVGAPAEASNATGVDGDQDDNSASFCGAVYVFRRTDGSWAQEAYIKASNSEASDQFGVSLSLSEDTLAVGARAEDSNAIGVDGDQNDNSAINSGAVYVFLRTGTTWAQEAYLKASNTDTIDDFGGSVSLSEDTLAVGAQGEASNATGIDGDETDNSAQSAGAVYVFGRTGGTWTQDAYIKASNTGLGDWFGDKVALSGDTLAVGAQGENSQAVGVDGDETDNGAEFSGAVYVFRWTGSSWAQEAYIKASNTEYGDNFGMSLALSGDTLAAGTVSESSSATGINGDEADNSQEDSGAVYFFRRVGATWTQEAYVKASNTGLGDWFGYSVALSGDTLAVGAPREDSDAEGIDGDQAKNGEGRSGAVYLFQ
jgi:hypothetical protein